MTCKNTMMGKKTREVCGVGCIGCRKCVKACPEGAVTVEDNLARIDPAACTGCGACMDACPTNTIDRLVFR